jgi:hypothetical protein
VILDGERIGCAISAEALQDHFGAASLRGNDRLKAFDAHSARIECATQLFLQDEEMKPVLTHTAFIQF